MLTRGKDRSSLCSESEQQSRMGRHRSRDRCPYLDRRFSEGQNLQDCGYLLNYDLHWNPTRMVQRAGRIDRIGTDFGVLWIYNMFPDRGLDRLLRLVDSLSERLRTLTGWEC